ncbi:MAG TPA: hypothetical protein LFV92_02925 [Rickettsia endosymbiont of Ceroptres masudai]|nr:hypothetical protein [Rickettsia endosymbiont of Ceroptres masudai]
MNCVSSRELVDPVILKCHPVTRPRDLEKIKKDWIPWPSHGMTNWT